MIFAKLDVCMWRHERFIEAGAAATGYWSAALARLREDSSSDGYLSPIAGSMLLRVGDREARKLCKRLVDVGLFETKGEGHVLLRYSQKNETKEDIEARRADTRSRVGAHRAAKRSGNGVHHQTRNALQPNVTGLVVPGSDSDSDSDSDSGSLSGSPSRSFGESLRGGKDSARGSRLDREWLPSQKVIDWARAEGIDASAHLGEFVAHWMAVPGKPGQKADWDRTFRNRLRSLRDHGSAKNLGPPLLKPPPPMAPEERAHSAAAAQKLIESLKFDRKCLDAKEIGNGKF